MKHILLTISLVLGATAVNAEINTELTDQLGGWSVSSIGQSYGVGHTLEQKYKAMSRKVL